MSAPTQEAIEAAARAAFETRWDGMKWEDDFQIGESGRDRYRREAAASLSAAYPFIEAQAKAEAWDEGFEDGKRQDFEGDDGPRFVNPYRAATIEGKGS